MLTDAQTNEGVTYKHPLPFQWSCMETITEKLKNGGNPHFSSAYPMFWPLPMSPLLMYLTHSRKMTPFDAF